MWGATLCSSILSRWIKCGVLHSIVAYFWVDKCGVLHSIVVYCQGGLHMGCYTL